MEIWKKKKTGIFFVIFHIQKAQISRERERVLSNVATDWVTIGRFLRGMHHNDALHFMLNRCVQNGLAFPSFPCQDLINIGTFGQEERRIGKSDFLRVSLNVYRQRLLERGRSCRRGGAGVILQVYKQTVHRSIAVWKELPLV